jgi:hypothetical protein
MRTLLRSALLFLGCALPAAAQDSPAAGFGAELLPVPPPILPSGPFGFPVFGVARTLANGDVVTFDGLSVRRVGADGTPIATLGTLPEAVFPGAFALAPGDALALLGESSTGALYRVALDGSGLAPIGNLPFNFDAVFEDARYALVSTNKTMSFADNHIVRLDVMTGAASDVCFVSGPSGPLALDPAGNLYYGQQLGSASSVLAWTAAQVAGGTLLGEADALTVSSGWNGIAALAVDPGSAQLYLAENHPVTGANALYRVLVTKALSPVLVSGGAPFQYMGGLEFDGASCGGVFAGYQPACGGTLRYSAVDFVSVAFRAAVEPARPQGALSGPGLSGPGLVTFSVAGGPPGGLAQIFIGPTSAQGSPETAYHLPGALPLLSGLPLSAIDLVGAPLPLDAGGAMALSVYHPGGLQGLLTVQAICITGAGALVGTSTAAHL